MAAEADVAAAAVVLTLYRAWPPLVGAASLLDDLFTATKPEADAGDPRLR